ncbi:hypothetical protein D3C71_1822940 [compost metagenome]
MPVDEDLRARDAADGDGLHGAEPGARLRGQGIGQGLQALPPDVGVDVFPTGKIPGAGRAVDVAGMGDAARAVNQRGAETRAAQIHRKHVAHDHAPKRQVRARAGGMGRVGRWGGM